MTRRLRGALLTAACLVLSSCTGSSADQRSSQGPLGTAEKAGTLCLPVRSSAGHTVTIGWDTVMNSATNPVTVDRVVQSNLAGASALSTS